MTKSGPSAATGRAPQAVPLLDLLLFSLFRVYVLLLRVFQFLHMHARHLLDFLASALYPHTWSFSVRRSQLPKVPAHLAITSRHLCGPQARAPLGHIAQLIAGCIDVRIKQFSLFLADRHWTYSDVSLLTSLLSQQLAAIGIAPVVCFVNRDPRDSWFNQPDAEPDDDRCVRVVIVGPACKKGDLSAADVVIQLLDQRHAHEGMVSAARRLARRLDRRRARRSSPEDGRGRAQPSRPAISREPVEIAVSAFQNVLPDMLATPGAGLGLFDDDIATAVPSCRFVPMPDMLLICGDPWDRSLQGYPPWGLAQAEIIFAPPISLCRPQTLFRALLRYSRTKQRHGR
jgi:hypothetical protein